MRAHYILFCLVVATPALTQEKRFIKFQVTSNPIGAMVFSMPENKQIGVTPATLQVVATPFQIATGVADTEVKLLWQSGASRVERLRITVFGDMQLFSFDRSLKFPGEEVDYAYAKTLLAKTTENPTAALAEKRSRHVGKVKFESVPTGAMIYFGENALASTPTMLDHTPTDKEVAAGTSTNVMTAVWPSGATISMPVVVPIPSSGNIVARFSRPIDSPNFHIDLAHAQVVETNAAQRQAAQVTIAQQRAAQQEAAANQRTAESQSGWSTLFGTINDVMKERRDRDARTPLIINAPTPEVEVDCTTNVGLGTATTNCRQR